MTSDWLKQSWLLFAVGSYWFLNIAFPWQEACWQMTWVWEKLCSQQFCYSIFEIKARWIQISWFLSGRCGIGRLATATAEYGTAFSIMRVCSFYFNTMPKCGNCAAIFVWHISIWISMTWRSRFGEYTQYHPIDHWKSFVLQEFCCARTFGWLNCDMFATCWGYISEETPALVVVPFSVLSNWQTELEYFVRWI